MRCAQQHREKREWWGDERGSCDHIHEAVGRNNEFIQCPARLLRVMISSPIQCSESVCCAVLPDGGCGVLVPLKSLNNKQRSHPTEQKARLEREWRSHQTSSAAMTWCEQPDGVVWLVCCAGCCFLLFLFLAPTAQFNDVTHPFFSSHHPYDLLSCLK